MTAAFKFSERPHFVFLRKWSAARESYTFADSR
jgi:hypothetical protein